MMARLGWWLVPLRGASRRAQRRWGLLAVCLLAIPVVFSGISTPAPWQDESATMLVMERNWSQLLPLLTNQDAPLVPYYVLVKPIVALLGWLPVLTVLRGISAAAAVVAVGAVYSLVVRRVGLGPALLAAGMLLAFPGFSRYAQEARPYAVLGALLALSWLAWDTWRRPEPGSIREPRRWFGVVGDAVGYVLALGAAAVVQLFGLFHWPAQLAADLTEPGTPWRARRRRAALTGTAMIVALAMVSVPVYFAFDHGTGSNHIERVYPGLFVDTFEKVIATHASLRLIVPVLVLVALAVVNAAVSSRFGGRYRDLVRVAGLWFAIPLAFTIAAALVKHQLLRVRYWTPLLPPLAILSAVGVLVAVELVVAALHRRPQRSATATYRWARVLTAVVVAVGLVGVTAVGLPRQLAIRAADGHGIALDAAVVRVDELLAQYPNAVLVVTPKGASSIVLATHPELRPREVLDWVDPQRNRPWPNTYSAEQVRQRVDAADTVIWLQLLQPTAQGTARTTRALKAEGYRKVSGETLGTFRLRLYRRG